MFIWGILLALLILNILVVLHEFGHFAVAKFRGVTVFEFGIGIPPRMGSVWTNSKQFNVARLPMVQERLIKKGSIISIAARRENGVLYAQNVVAGRQISPEFAQDDDAEIFIGKVKRSDTVEAVVAVSEWSLNWLPIGGFVRMLGEEAGNQRGSLATKSYFTRFMVIFAGVLINFLLPFLIFMGLHAVPHEQYTNDVIVSAVAPGSPAMLQGIQSGDRILEIDGRTVRNFSDVGFLITGRTGAEADLLVQRDGAEVLVEDLVPRRDAPDLTVGTDISLLEAQIIVGDTEINLGDPLAQGSLGIYTVQTEVSLTKVSEPFGEALLNGLRQGIDSLRFIYHSLIGIVAGSNASSMGPALVGPLGLGELTGGLLSADVPLPILINVILLLAASLSFSLAIFNVLPFPPLDGGRILFLFIELSTGRRRVPARVAQFVNSLGFMLLLGLIIYVTFNDALRLLGV